jgi:hypothetical protein
MAYIVEYKKAEGNWKRSPSFSKEYDFQTANRYANDLQRLSCTGLVYRVSRAPEPPKTIALDLPAIELWVIEHITGLLREIEVSEMVKTIPFDKVYKYLPFPIETARGNNFVHIVNASAYAVVTERRTVDVGQPLCGRFSRRGGWDVTKPCPGCLAIAQGLAARFVLEGK